MWTVKFDPCSKEQIESLNCKYSTIFKYLHMGEIYTSSSEDVETIETVFWKIINLLLVYNSPSVEIFETVKNHVGFYENLRIFVKKEDDIHMWEIDDFKNYCDLLDSLGQELVFIICTRVNKSLFQS